MERSELEEIMRLVVLSVVVCVCVHVSVCLLHELGENMHFNERLLVNLHLIC